MLLQSAMNPASCSSCAGNRSSGRALPAASSIIRTPSTVNTARRILSKVPGSCVLSTSSRRPLAAPPAGYGVPPSSYGVPLVPPVDPDQLALQATASLQKTLSFCAFWLQLALSISAACVLLFASGFAPRTVGSASVGADLSKWLTLVAVVLAFISSFFAHGFLNLATKLQAGSVVSRAWITRTLITNNTLNLAGIIATAIALQASVGTLVAKSLVTSAYGASPYQQAAPALVSIDVFGLQASTNSLLCHIVSLVFTNIMLRIITPKAPPPADVVVGLPLGGPAAPPLRG